MNPTTVVYVEEGKSFPDVDECYWKIEATLDQAGIIKFRKLKQHWQTRYLKKGRIPKNFIPQVIDFADFPSHYLWSPLGVKKPWI
jgi:hypothetical protein